MATTKPPPLDLNNVQGDILAGLPSKTQTYYFFSIDQSRVNEFRHQLARLVPLITTTAQVFGHRSTISQAKTDARKRGVLPPLLQISGVNIVFSHTGLHKIGIDDSQINDAAFLRGMFKDAVNLGDPGTANGGDPDYVPAFKNGVDGMILVSGESHGTVAVTLAEIESIFLVGSPLATIHEMIRLVGDVRPGKEKGHEHFGFKDGISQPAVSGVDATAHPGQEFVQQGCMLLGRDGDLEIDGVVTKGQISRPPWALDGSFLAFRYLFQLVPEFHTFLKRNPIPGIEPDLGSDLLGARFVGRWMSGAPVDLAPTADNPDLGNDAEQNNNFTYNFPGDQTTQDRCPFAAHTRKSNPRSDLELPPFSAKLESRRIMRRGIQFGPEVTPAESASGKTTLGRGLLFAGYQSNIINAFQFVQQSWVDKTNFPPKSVEPGLDPIIGQAAGGPRSMTGANPASQSASTSLPTWVVPKGGEYFFSPSLPTLRNTFALKA